MAVKNFSAVFLFVCVCVGVSAVRRTHLNEHKIDLPFSDGTVSVVGVIVRLGEGKKRLTILKAALLAVGCSCTSSLAPLLQ